MITEQTKKDLEEVALKAAEKVTDLIASGILKAADLYCKLFDNK